MSDNLETNPVGEAQAAVPPQRDLAAELELLKAKNQELIGEKQKVKATFDDMQAQIAELKNQSTKQKQAKLQEAGEYKALWDEATKTNSQLQDEIAGLRKQLEEKDVAFQSQQIKANAINAFTQSGVHSPEHLFNLLKDNLRLTADGVKCLHGGVEVNLTDHLANLKSPGSGFDYFFQGSGARGMGAMASSPSTGGGDNPYVTGNFAEIVRLETEDPQMAARMKAQAA